MDFFRDAGHSGKTSDLLLIDGVEVLSLSQFGPWFLGRRVADHGLRKFRIRQVSEFRQNLPENGIEQAIARSYTTESDREFNEAQQASDHVPNFSEPLRAESVRNVFRNQPGDHRPSNLTDGIATGPTVHFSVSGSFEQG
jgi:hypothetical protein